MSQQKLAWGESSEHQSGNEVGSQKASDGTRYG